VERRTRETEVTNLSHNSCETLKTIVASDRKRAPIQGAEAVEALEMQLRVSLATPTCNRKPMISQEKNLSITKIVRNSKSKLSQRP